MAKIHTIRFTKGTKVEDVFGYPSNHAEKQQAAVDRFNREHPVGTPVKYHSGGSRGVIETTVRSAAEVLHGHTAVCWLDGVSGCVDLTHIKPIQPRAMAHTEKTSPPHFWYLVTGDFTIGDYPVSDVHDEVFTMSMSDMANNKALLNALKLAYMPANDEKERGQVFASYMASFGNDSRQDACHKKAQSNPMLCLIIHNSAPELLIKVKDIMNKPATKP